MKNIPILNVIQGLHTRYAYTIIERWPNVDGRLPVQCWQEDGLSEQTAKKNPWRKGSIPKPICSFS